MPAASETEQCCGAAGAHAAAGLADGESMGIPLAALLAAATTALLGSSDLGSLPFDGPVRLQTSSADGPSVVEAAPAPVGCRYDLTEVSGCTSTRCVLPATTRPQGSGWVEGDFSAAAFSGSHAALVLAANSTALPPLSVLIRRVRAGVVLPTVVARGAVSASRAMNLSIDIRSWPNGEYTIAAAPDEGSARRGWCGELRRFLRKVEPQRAPRRGAAVYLRIDQPTLFLDDFFIAYRARTARTLVPAVQQRIANDSFCGTKRHPWMKIDRPPQRACGTCAIEFGLRVNYGSAVSPLDDPASEQYDCSGILNATARDGSRVWTCWLRRSDMDVDADPEVGMPSPFHTDEAAVPSKQDAWPPPPLHNWPIASTRVRYYVAADGPVDLTQISVFYTYGSDSGHAPTVINNMTFSALSGTPVWQRLHAGVKETLVLPVNGVRGRPLLHCGTPPSQLKNPNVTCRDPDYCQCAGPNITDIGCSNDNFGGSWLLPAQNNQQQDASASSPPLMFVYAQARRISAYAPTATAYDNLAQERRVLVTWRTVDGLWWEQAWWEGTPPTLGRRYVSLPTF